MEIKERVARAIAKQYAQDPDFRDYGQTPDGYADAEHMNWFPEADAVLRALAEAGFVIVPREPTEVMADEAAKEICRQQFIDPDGVTALAGGQHRNWSLRRPVARATLRAAISEGAK